MIPTNKQDAVQKALQHSFGISTYDAIAPLTKGLSGSLVSKITVHGIPYLLKLIRPDSRDIPSQYFGCMQTAADAGLAPKVHYLSIEDGILLTDYITAKSFPIPDAREKMAGFIRQLHALPKFSSRLDYVVAADGFIKKFRDTHIVPETDMENMYEAYQRMSKVYPTNDEQNMVSSHNDIKPDNIIYDGTKPWLVDWEAGRLNDRYLDLAAAANFLVKNDQDEAHFLERYFGEAPDEYQRARYFLMSNIVHLFCFSLCTMMVAGSKPVDIKIAHPDFAAFHDGLWQGEINLANNHEKLQYALVHLEEYKRKIQDRRFDESLRVVAEYEHAGTVLNQLVN